MSTNGVRATTSQNIKRAIQGSGRASPTGTPPRTKKKGRKK